MSLCLRSSYITEPQRGTAQRKRDGLKIRGTREFCCVTKKTRVFSQTFAGRCIATQNR